MLLPFLNRFLHWLIVGIMTTVLSLSLLSRGASLGQLGLLLGIYGSVVVVLELPSGILSDLLGRKRIYLLSLILSAAGYLFLIPARGFIPLVGGICLIGAARAFSSGSIESLFIADELKKEGGGTLDRLLRTMGIGETLGLCLGALLGGLLPQAWAWFRPGANRYDANLLAQLFFLALLFVLTAISTREGPATSEAKEASLWPALRLSLSQPLVRLILLASLFWGLSLGAVETWWQPRLRHILGSDTQSWIFGLVNGGYFLSSLLGVLASKGLASKGHGPSLFVLAFLRILMGGLIVLLSFVDGLLGFALVYLLISFSNGLASILESGVFNRAIPEAGRASLLSFASLAVQLGGAASSFATAAIVPSLGIGGAWLIAGAVFMASAACYLWAGWGRAGPQARGRAEKTGPQEEAAVLQSGDA